MTRILIYGMGYTASRIAGRLSATKWRVDATGTAGNLAFDDDTAMLAALEEASHVLSSVPPGDGDPVLGRFGEALTRFDGWIGYLSSTGVYGDTDGAWVDETAPTGSGRRSARVAADKAWLELGARVFRLPGIYGPGRSALDRVVAGTAKWIKPSKQVFSRVHVEDIVSGVIAAFDAPPGAYNLADDLPCSQNFVIEEACRMLGAKLPQLQSLDEAKLGLEARGFYAENRRVANSKAKRVLGWRPAFPTYREGLRALKANTIPSSASTAPVPASKVQR